MTLWPSRLAAAAIAKPKPEFAPVMKKVLRCMLACPVDRSMSLTDNIQAGGHPSLKL
ncbi:hypothetical protein [Mesorhizobium opportunistum]|uniref:hypothetical protein n=1 Tax=Mesorhizobium opportunistum TaxID=593909 RepID=UPI001FD9E8FE|nr:hypothetical protein [Mesorhizobium opportunistum]